MTCHCEHGGDALLEAVKQAGLDSVEGAFAWQGGQELEKPNLQHRRRTRLELTDRNGDKHELYLKRYERESFFARLTRVFTCGLHSSPAGAEFENIHLLNQAGIPTMKAVTFGCQMGFLGATRSYLIVTAVPGDAIERCGRKFFESNAANTQILENFTAKLADLVRQFHQTGMVHRDLYASHIFMDEHNGRIGFFLIDLARAFRPRLRKFRWRVKDLARLKYSMPKGWIESFWEKFLMAYLADERFFEQYNSAVNSKCLTMQKRANRKIGQKVQ